MRTLAFPDVVEVVPGGTGEISITVTNTSSVIDAYRVQVFGLDPEWVDIRPERVSLFPGQSEHIDVSVRLPDDYPASERTLAVNVSSDDDPGAFSLNQVHLAVQPRTVTSLRVDPVMVTSGRRARFGLVVANEGNAVVEATAFGVDPEELAEFTFTPANVLVAPGREQVIEATVSGGRAWFGQPRARVLTFGVDAERRVEAIGTFIQRPRISRWLISLLGLLTAAAVFAAVLSHTFDRVVDEAKVSSDVLDAALKRDSAGGVLVPANPGGVSGSLVSATTGDGLSGVQAELYVADDTDTPIGSAATGADGGFTFAQLGAGDYLLKLVGSGVAERWYPDADHPADATPITVVLGEVTALDPITIGGVPVDVTGAIDVDDPAGVVVSVVVPGEAASGGAVVATAELAPDGSFVLEDVPSPGTYQLIVEQPGAEPQVRDLVLEPGRDAADLSVMVQPGGGEISGTVTGPGGPLGGATVSASDGSVEIDTVTLTEGAVGNYTLRNLPVPGQYTVTVSRPGFAPESRTVSLTLESTAGSFDARLLPAVGSITGRVLVDGLPGRGLTVTVNGGDVARTVGVISQGAEAGVYRIGALPAPGTYTLTFSGPDVIPQVRVVDLDPNSGTENASSIDVSLAPDLTVVRGVVRGPDGQPVSLATVELSDGTTSRTLRSADDPVGEFEFTDVAPGAYTLTASRTGTEPVVVLVNVSSTAAVSEFDLRLGTQASLTGLVTGFDPTLRTAVVRLFDPAQFPGGAALAVVQTDAAGQYTFPGIEAPANYVVAVYATTVSADPLASTTITAAPGQPVTVPTFTVQLP